MANIALEFRLIAASLIISILILSPAFYFLSSTNPRTIWSPAARGNELLNSQVIMGSMRNETTRAAVGRASWLSLHTMGSRFPDKPTAHEREALNSFLNIFSITYPCGDCAQHFQDLLHQYPMYPHTVSRSAAAGHLCKLHNLVNERLKKPQYDCSTIEEQYDCGCGIEPGRRDPITGVELVDG